MEAKRGTAISTLEACLAGALAALAAAVVETLLAARADAADGAALLRGLVLVGGLTAAIGFAAGLACAALRRPHAAAAAGIALIPALAVLGAGLRPLNTLAALSILACGVLVGERVLARFPLLAGARTAGIIALALLAVAGGFALVGKFDERWAAGATGAWLVGAVVALSPNRRLAATAIGATGLALAWHAATQLPRITPSASARVDAPSVLLVTIDTLRADRVGAYGYAAARTPTFDGLARSGVLFREVIANSVLTGPSHASILSGQLPTTHGLFTNGAPLDSRTETLAESFASAGYVTAAFPSAPPTTRQMARLGDHFHYQDDDLRSHRLWPKLAWRCAAPRALRRWLAPPNPSARYRPAAPTVDLAMRWLEAHAGKPTFTWVHLFDPHLPYQPPALLAGDHSKRVAGKWYELDAAARAEIVRDPAKLAAMHALYDAEIAYADRELGRLVQVAREAAPGGQLFVVVTADHGELMGERGQYWTRDLHDETVRVPLVIAPPEPLATPREIAIQVRSIDIAPTLLAWIGLPPLAKADGANLLPLVRDGQLVDVGPAITFARPVPGEFQRAETAVRTLEFKLIASDAGWILRDVWAPAARRLFDLAADPRESRDVAAERAEIVAQLERSLPTHAQPASATLSDDTREQLRALGYVE